MSAIITEKFRQHNASQFVESFTEQLLQLIICSWEATAYTSTTTGGSDSSPPDSKHRPRG